MKFNWKLPCLIKIFFPVEYKSLDYKAFPKICILHRDLEF